MKNMSLGKLMAIFAGSLVVIVIITVIIAKATSAPSPSKVVTQRYQMQQFQPQQPDILAEQFRRAQEKFAAEREMYLQQAQAMQQALQQQMQRIDSIANSLKTMDQRIAAIEKKLHPTGVQVIKPERKPRKSLVKKKSDEGCAMLSNSGYNVLATVGKRAWIAAGEHEDSVSVGDPLPPVKKPLVVRAVDNESGVVITSSAR